MTDQGDYTELVLPTDLWRSQGDEDSFFCWLYSIPGYVTCRGVGTELFIHFSLKDVTRTGLRELVALFKRYGVPDLAQLRVFKDSSVGAWFSSPETYWYEDIFK